MMTGRCHWQYVILGIFLLFACTPGLSQAHTRSESHTTWSITGNTVRVDVTLSDVEAARLTDKGQRPEDRLFLAYFGEHLAVNAEGMKCPSAGTAHILTASPGYRRGEYIFVCATANKMALEFTGLFETVPTHVDFAQIQLDNGDMVEQLFTKDMTVVDAGAGNGDEFREAGIIQFIGMGIMHIFTGVDHMSFLLGLILLARRLKDLLFVVTGFTIGHSLTLALAVTGIIRPHAEFIDALVALTIALVGVESIIHTQARPWPLALLAGGFFLFMGSIRLMGIGVLPPLLLFGTGLFVACYLMISMTVQNMGRIRLLVTLIFGLIHGFGFASDLLKDKLPAAKLAQILFGFNLGVEIGQVSVVLGIIGFVLLLKKLKLSSPRPITVDITASALVALGVYWFVSRSF